MMITTSFVMVFLLTLLTGLIYPLVMTIVAGALFPHQASGSLRFDQSQVTGSRLIGQQFENQKYFWSRPSATSPSPFNPAASSGSNYGPLNPEFRNAVSRRIFRSTC
jgi:K+-transporting ATPase ATPase C chain